MSTDSEMEKRIKKLLDDMKLVTETAMVLATKLKKLQSSLEEILPYAVQSTTTTTTKQPDTIVRETATTRAAPPRKTQKTPPRPIPRPSLSEQVNQKTVSPPSSATTQPSPMDARGDTIVDTITGIFKNLRDDIEKTTTGKEISRFLLDAQDKLLELKGFHPALREMRSFATDFKGRSQLTREDKHLLIEKTYEWEQRMTT